MENNVKQSSNSGFYNYKYDPIGGLRNVVDPRNWTELFHEQLMRRVFHDVETSGIFVGDKKCFKELEDFIGSEFFDRYNPNDLFNIAITVFYLWVKESISETLEYDL